MFPKLRASTDTRAKKVGSFRNVVKAFHSNSSDFSDDKLAKRRQRPLF